MRDSIMEITDFTNSKYVKIVFGGVVPILISIMLYCFYDYQSHDNDNNYFLTFVMGIMTVSGAILAVGLTVFQGMFSEVSNTYGHGIQNMIINKRQVDITFGLFLSTIITCIAFFFLPVEHVKYSISAIVGIVSSAMVFFALSLHYTSSMKNNIKIIDFMHKKISEDLKRK